MLLYYCFLVILVTLVTLSESISDVETKKHSSIEPSLDDRVTSVTPSPLDPPFVQPLESLTNPPSEEDTINAPSTELSRTQNGSTETESNEPYLDVESSEDSDEFTDVTTTQPIGVDTPATTKPDSPIRNQARHPGNRKIPKFRDTNKVFLEPQFRYHNPLPAVREGIYGKPKTAWYGEYDIWSAHHSSTTSSVSVSKTRTLENPNLTYVKSKSESETVEHEDKLDNTTVHYSIDHDFDDDDGVDRDDMYYTGGIDVIAPSITSSGPNLLHHIQHSILWGCWNISALTNGTQKTHTTEITPWKDFVVVGEDFYQMEWRNRLIPPLSHRPHKHKHRSNRTRHHSTSQMKQGFPLYAEKSHQTRPSCSSVFGMVVFAVFVVCL